MSDVDLASLLRETLAAKRMSSRDAAKNSGGLVSNGTLTAIMRGDHSGQVQDKTIDGIALALGLTRERVYKAATGQAPSEPFTLPPRANRLTPKQRRAVRDIIDAMLDDGERANVVPLRQVTEQPAPAVRRAARKAPANQPKPGEQEQTSP